MILIRSLLDDGWLSIIMVNSMTKSCRWFQRLVCVNSGLIYVTQISFLDSVPDIHIHEHVPEFIDGLFCILGDQRKEIRRM